MVKDIKKRVRLVPHQSLVKRNREINPRNNLLNKEVEEDIECTLIKLKFTNKRFY